MTEAFSRRALIAGGLALSGGRLAAQPAPVTLLNVAMGPTRDLYKEIDAAFAADWKARTGQTVTINVDAGGSGGQVRKVLAGLQPDVVNLALAPDIEILQDKAGLLPANWQARLPHHSAPYASVILFLVKKGNPRGIRDWGDLVRPGTTVITSIAKVSGGARWNYLAAWAWACGQKSATPASAEAFLHSLYANVPATGDGAGKALQNFAQGDSADVFLAWENEAHLALNQFGPDKFEIVAPTISILAEPPVALVDKYADAHGTRKVAEAYLRFLYTPAAQEIIARNFFRPRDLVVAGRHKELFPPVRAVAIDDALFGGWKKAETAHFGAGGPFDRVMASARKV